MKVAQYKKYKAVHDGVSDALFQLGNILVVRPVEGGAMSP